jgi:hypothetical protein
LTIPAVGTDAPNRLVQSPRRRDKLVQVGKLAVGVLPHAAKDPFSVDEECRPQRNVVKSPPLAADAESADGVPVEVGEQGEVQVERLRPSDVAPGGVAGSRYRADADLL